MTSPAGTLTLADYEAACAAFVPWWFLARLDTRLATADVVPLLKAICQGWGAVTTCQDGDYPEWAHHFERNARGVLVQVTRGDEIIREGQIVWNQLANWATLAACERRRIMHEPQPGDQLALTV